MNILGMVFMREGSKLPLYGGCKVGCEKKNSTKTNFFCRKSIRGVHSHWNFCYPTPNSSPNGDAKLGVNFFFRQNSLFYSKSIRGSHSHWNFRGPTPYSTLQCVEKLILSPVCFSFLIEKLTVGIMFAMNRNA